MQISFLRVGKLGVDGQVGFLCHSDGSVAAFKSADEALRTIDYKGSDPVSSVIHYTMFDPVAYVFKVLNPEDALDILRRGLSQAGKIKSTKLHNISGSTKVVTFPEGKDPFPNAVKVEKQLSLETLYSDNSEDDDTTPCST
jgi:hypothetical protein